MTDLSKHRAPRIHPTVGRVVLFHLGEPTRKPCPGWSFTPDGSNTYAAIVAYVHSLHMVNLSAWDSNGIQMGFTSVPLVHADDERMQLTQGERYVGHWCEWMPYQKGQAAKAEQIERQITERAPTLNEPYKPEPEPETAHGERVKRIEEHLRMEREAHAPNDPGVGGSITGSYLGENIRHPAIAATQQLDNDGNALAREPVVTGCGGQASLDPVSDSADTGRRWPAPTIPQD